MSYITGFIILVISLSQPSITVKGPEGTYHVGDEIPLTLTIRYNKAFHVELLRDISLEPFFVKKIEKTSNLEGDEIVQSLFFTLTTFTVGDLKIPSLHIDYRNPDGTIGSISSSEIILNIQSVLDPKTQDIMGTKPPLRIIEKDYTLLWTVGGLVALGLAAALLLRRLSKRTIQEQMPAAPMSPEEMSLKELESIAGAGLLERGLWKEYYSRISDVLRRFVELRRGITAMEMTTSEVLRALRKSFQENSHLTLLQGVLEESDLVKFAKYIPADGQAREALNNARSFVTSRPKPSPPIPYTP